VAYRQDFIAIATLVDLSSGDLGVNLTLTSLPRLSPEPSLGGRR
jgi:hypothetical protein